MLADCWLCGGYLDVDVVRTCMNQLKAGGCLHMIHMGYLACMNECFIVINQSTSDI